VDGQTIEDLYFPAAVTAVEIPKPHGGGVRVLGVPKVEPIFDPDSYGYVCPEQEGSLM
jgi:hypothetical protein